MKKGKLSWHHAPCVARFLCEATPKAKNGPFSSWGFVFGSTWRPTKKYVLKPTARPQIWLWQKVTRKPRIISSNLFYQCHPYYGLGLAHYGYFMCCVLWDVVTVVQNYVVSITDAHLNRMIVPPIFQNFNITFHILLSRWFTITWTVLVMDHWLSFGWKIGHTSVK